MGFLWAVRSQAAPQEPICSCVEVEVKAMRHWEQTVPALGRWVRTKTWECHLNCSL